jgi:hypothetical protein
VFLFSCCVDGFVVVSLAMPLAADSACCLLPGAGCAAGREGSEDIIKVISRIFAANYFNKVIQCIEINGK